MGGATLVQSHMQEALHPFLEQVNVAEEHSPSLDHYGASSSSLHYSAYTVAPGTSGRLVIIRNLLKYVGGTTIVLLIVHAARFGIAPTAPSYYNVHDVGRASARTPLEWNEREISLRNWSWTPPPPHQSLLNNLALLTPVSSNIFRPLEYI